MFLVNRGIFGVHNVVTNLMRATYYLDYFCGNYFLSHCSDKLGSNCLGVYAVVRVHAHLLGIICVCARSLCVCMRAYFIRRAWVHRVICR